MVEALETNAEDGKTQGRLETRLEDLLKDDTFRKQLEEWMQKPGSEKLREKNIFTAKQDLKGTTLRVGDKAAGDDDYDRKNIVSLEKGEFSGDIIVGDGH